ncbi:unnamed protein product [Parajaminaea phylloscopi]
MATNNTVYHFDVKMTCSGCSSAIERVLTRLQTTNAVASFKVDLQAQTVEVHPSSGAAALDLEGVREKIAKTGKEIRSYKAQEQ